MLVLLTDLKSMLCSLQYDYYTYLWADYSSQDIINLIFKKSVGQEKKSAASGTFTGEAQNSGQKFFTTNIKVCKGTVHHTTSHEGPDRGADV